MYYTRKKYINSRIVNRSENTCFFQAINSQRYNFKQRNSRFLHVPHFSHLADTPL